MRFIRDRHEHNHFNSISFQIDPRNFTLDYFLVIAYS